MAWTNAGWHEDWEDETFPPELHEDECFDGLHDDDGLNEDEFMDDEFDSEVARQMEIVGYECVDEYPF